MPIEYQTLKVKGVTWESLPNLFVIKTLLLESGGNTTCKTLIALKYLTAAQIYYPSGEKLKLPSKY